MLIKNFNTAQFLFFVLLYIIVNCSEWETVATNFLF